MNLDRENMKKLMFLITFTVILLVGVQRLDVVLGTLDVLVAIFFPFVFGGAVAFFLNVPMAFLERLLFGTERKEKWKRKLARPLSLLLTVVLVIAVIVLVIFVVVPELSSTVTNLALQIEAAIPKAQEWLNDIFQNNEQVTAWLESQEVNWETMIRTGLNMVQSGAESVLVSMVLAARGLINAVYTFVIAVAFSCYVLIQKEKLCVQARMLLRALLPQKHADRVLYIFSLSYRTFTNFITGQCLEAMILGTMFFVVMSILRFPYALLVGILVAVTALIPIFGAFIGCAIGAFLILVVNPMQALAFVALFLVLQQVEGNLIYPHVVGNSVGLPSIWVLVAVTVGGNLMGLVGMLIFIPLVSVLYTLLREWVYRRLREKKLREEDV